LEQLVKSGIDIQIFTPSFQFGWRSECKIAMKGLLYNAGAALRRLGVRDFVLEGVPLLNKTLCWTGKPVSPVNQTLRPHLMPAAFGRAMYQTIADSCVSLNVHADSSPEYASNMRLFEITGMGSCLLTDWKANFSDLFVPDTEAITYRSAEECLDKLSWLLAHPETARAVARAGQQRCLRQHTFEHRAAEFDALARTLLAQRRTLNTPTKPAAASSATPC
jgi:hypothetical protein